MTRRLSVLLSALALVCMGTGCARYERQVLPGREPSAYTNMREVGAVQVAARAWRDEEEAEEDFGFDILSADVLPVQVVVQNGSQSDVRIVAGQTFLVQSDGQMWPLLPLDVARERIEKSTGWGEVAPGAGRGALFGGAGGTLIGAAVGVVTGSNVARSAGRGLVVGAAGGAVVGGAHGLGDRNVGRAIAQDLRNASLENSPIRPGQLGHGVLFFPGEARGAGTLRLRVDGLGGPPGQVLEFSI